MHRYKVTLTKAYTHCANGIELDMLIRSLLLKQVDLSKVKIEVEKLE